MTNKYEIIWLIFKKNKQLEYSLTLFFPLLLISRHKVSCSSVSSCLLSKSLNWNNKYSKGVPNYWVHPSIYWKCFWDFESPHPLASWWSHCRVWEGLAPVPRRINTIPRWTDMQIWQYVVFLLLLKCFNSRRKAWYIENHKMWWIMNDGFPTRARQNQWR